MQVEQATSTSPGYGAVRQYRYHLGDVLRWDCNDVGGPDAPEVVDDAWVCECPSCNHNGSRKHAKVPSCREAISRPR